MKEHITIGKKVFIAPIRYMPGHVMTEEESDAFSKFVLGKGRNALAKKDGLTQEELDRWVANYQPGTRRSRSDPVIAEAKLIAKRFIKGKKKDVKAIDKVLAKHSDKIMEIARRRVKDIATVSEMLLSDG